MMSVTDEDITIYFASPGAEIEYDALGHPVVIGSAVIDYYTLDASPVTSPLYEQGRRKHGAMLTPLPDGHPSVQNKITEFSQGFDGYVNYAAWRDASLNLPLTLTPGNTFIVGMSWLDQEEGTPGCPTWEHNNDPTKDNGPRGLKRCFALAAVSESYRGLMSQHLRQSAFSPTYTSPTPISSVNLGLLPNYPDAGGWTTSVSSIITKNIKFATDYSGKWSSRYTKPVLAAEDYGRNLGLQYAVAMIHCITDRATASEKAQIAYGLVQRGIDLYGAMKEIGVWPGAGGHGVGRLALMLFTARLLEDTTMFNDIMAWCGGSSGDDYYHFDEHMHYYYAPNSTNPLYPDALFGLSVGPGGIGTGCGTGYQNHDCRDPNEHINDPVINGWSPGAYRRNGTMVASLYQILVLHQLGFSTPGDPWDVGSTVTSPLGPAFFYGDYYYDAIPIEYAGDPNATLWQYWNNFGLKNAYDTFR